MVSKNKYRSSSTDAIFILVANRAFYIPGRRKVLNTLDILASKSSYYSRTLLDIALLVSNCGRQVIFSEAFARFRILLDIMLFVHYCICEL